MKNLTRAAVVYLGATLATVGCGEDLFEPEPVVQPYGAPPNPPEVDLDIEAARAESERADAQRQAEAANSAYGGAPVDDEETRRLRQAMEDEQARILREQERAQEPER